MELRIWQYGSDDKYIPSFLEGMSVAHKQPSKSLDWFHWKFEHSPYGKSILACAFDNERVAGCVAYGKGLVRYKNKEWKCALSYETFVHPNYQGHGLFKKLIDLAEKEAVSQKISFLYNFPNSKSLTGFKHMGWIERNDKETFRLKIVCLSSLLFNAKDIRKPFIPNKQNLDQLENNRLLNITNEKCDDDVVMPIWTKDYLKWRFFSYPNREYHVIDNNDYFVISMVGHRGKLKNVHLLYAVSKNNNKRVSSYAKAIVKVIKKELHPDLISYASTTDDPMVNALKGFFSVPSHSNFCYKVLDSNMEIDNLKIILPSINAHTY